jgi:hypothetical protein
MPELAFLAALVVFALGYTLGQRHAGAQYQRGVSDAIDAHEDVVRERVDGIPG